jgi:hypothetical protein
MDIWCNFGNMPGSNKLKPALSEKFSAIIWKIEVDEAEAIIAIETRDRNSHSAAFSALNYKSGKCYFKEKSIENSWWWGLDKVHKGVVYLHGYKNESSPEHRGIIAWDALTGKTKWERFDYALDSVSDQGVLVYNPMIQPSKPELISAETGQTVKEKISANSVIIPILFPKIYNDLLSLPDFIPEDVVKPIVHLAYKEVVCWSFHVKTNDGFAQNLIVTRNKEIILSDNLATGIQKLNPEAFFIHKSYLFYVRNNNYELVSYLL